MDARAVVPAVVSRRVSAQLVYANDRRAARPPRRTRSRPRRTLFA